jgi:hypothetical protein
VSVQHFVDSFNAVVFTLCWREVTRDEIVASLAGLRSRPGFQASFRQLIDLSQSSKTALDFKDLCGIHLADDPFSNEGRRAFVAPQGSASFGFARMYQSIVDSSKIEVFDSLADAIRWLRLDVSISEGGRLVLLPPEVVPRMYRKLWKRLVLATTSCSARPAFNTTWIKQHGE